MSRRYAWLGVLVLMALGAAAYWHFFVHEPSSTASTRPPAATIPVVATIAETRNVSDYLTGLGNVQAFNRVTVHVRVDGELQDIRFTEGQFVHAGDVLAQIDPRLFQAALDQAKAKKAQDEAMLIAAQKDLVRAKTLIDKNFQTQQVLDQTQARVDQLIAAVAADKAAIENAETQLSYTTVVSPIDGRMGLRLIDKGNIVHAGDPTGLVVITQVQPIAVIFSLPQDYLQNITAAMKQAPLKVTAYSRDNTTKLGEGTLLLIDNQIDTATGTLRLKASFPNEDDASVAGPVRQCPARIGAPKEHGRRTRAGRATRTERALCLRGQIRPERRTARHQSRRDPRRPCGHRLRHRGRRARRRRWPIQDPARRQGRRHHDAGDQERA